MRPLTRRRRGRGNAGLGRGNAGLRPPAGPRYNPFFADPNVVEDDYLRMRNSPSYRRHSGR
jgi:hypothetical protein